MEDINWKKVGYIQSLVNRYGDFRVAVRYQPLKVINGVSIEWSKWRSALWCWENEYWKFLSEINNRELFKDELVLDFDPKDNEDYEAVKKRVEICIKDLKLKGIDYTLYFSGSRGFHLHIIIPLLSNLDSSNRQKVRTHWIKKYGCDLQKNSDNVMIALENNPHWKTGKMKKEVVLE